MSYESRAGLAKCISVHEDFNQKYNMGENYSRFSPVMWSKLKS